MSLAIVDHLLEQAEHLAAREERGRPREASLRRAVSAAYYALFHQIADEIVTTVVGAAAAGAPLGARLRRTVQHATVKTAAGWFLRSPGPKALDGILSNPVPQDLTTICDRFVILQKERHRADYDLASSFSRSEVQRLVSDAKNTVTRLRTLSASDDKTIFLLGCLLGQQLIRNA